MQILEVLRWPLAAVACVLIVVITLRYAPFEFFSRARRPGSGGKSLLVDPYRAFAVNQQRELEQVKPAGETVHATHVLPPPNPALDQFEQEIQTLLAEIKLPPELEKAWLIRIVAHWRVMYGHEVTYRMIVGSQITLLLLANTISDRIKPAGETVHATHVLPPPNPALDQFEQEIQTLLAEIKLPPELEKAWLIRIVAHWRVMYGHEVTYRMIVGSQITLLLLANTI